MAKETSKKPVWGPENPHPLSGMKTELVWEGKYDEYGARRAIKLPASALPLQRIETIDEPRDREHAVQGELFEPEKFTQKAHRDDFRNMLVWGDSKLALAALLERFRGKVDLIYIDPPFDVGADFTMQVQIGDEGDALQKEQSILEAVAYRDTWGKGTDSYLHMMYERLTLMRASSVVRAGSARPWTRRNATQTVTSPTSTPTPSSYPRTASSHLSSLTELSGSAAWTRASSRARVLSLPREIASSSSPTATTPS